VTRSPIELSWTAKKCAEKKGKKTKRSERGPKKSAQNSPATFQSTQNGANES